MLLMPTAVQDRVLRRKGTQTVARLSDLGTRGQVVPNDDVELFHGYSSVELGCAYPLC